MHIWLAEVAMLVSHLWQPWERQFKWLRLASLSGSYVTLSTPSDNANYKGNSRVIELQPLQIATGSTVVQRVMRYNRTAWDRQTRGQSDIVRYGDHNSWHVHVYQVCSTQVVVISCVLLLVTPQTGNFSFSFLYHTSFAY